MTAILNLDLQPLDMKTYSPITLAFVGDAVYELLVRQYIVQHMNAHANKLHLKAVEKVCCTFQSASVSRIEAMLNENEADIFRRGRNSSTQRVPKNAKPVEYRRATGLEALFGYLYLKGENGRIQQLFQKIIEDDGESGQASATEKTDARQLR